MALPPPREGYHRDADPDGQWEEEYTSVKKSETVVTIVNWPAVVATIAGGLVGLSLFIPFNILLWRWAL